MGTRPFVDGDPQRHINWKASARWDTLITNLFEQERIADIGIVLDARKVAEVSNGDESLFEHSVQAAAGLARYFLGKGNRGGAVDLRELYSLDHPRLWENGRRRG
ncbi:MAG: DUF58 domain-containing protein [Candidatus Moduliflexus flocculans]|nr:DUF58 domain-containing protein [Candidatus Moduliflexus flocculans]